MWIIGPDPKEHRALQNEFIAMADRLSRNSKRSNAYRVNIKPKSSFVFTARLCNFCRIEAAIFLG